MKQGGRVVDTGQLPAHIFKQDIGRVGAVHHVHVDLPHAPAGVDGLFEIVQQLDAGGFIQIKGLQLFIAAQNLIHITVPQPVIILNEGQDRFFEPGLPPLLFLFTLHQEQGEVTSPSVKTPIPSLNRGQAQFFRTVLHAMAAEIDPEPAEHGRPRRDRVGAVQKPGG